MGLLKKNKQPEIPEHESASLEAAMSELTKQTEALLGKVGEEKPPKPHLPKKHAKPTVKGRSFDIIHDPKRKTQLKATLKSVEKTHTKIVPTQDDVDVLLLADHATKSYNEISETSEESSKQQSMAVSTPVVVHHEGKLALAPIESLPDSASVIEQSVEPKEVQQVSHKSLSFTENKDETDDAESAVAQVSDTSIENSEVASQELQTEVDKDAVTDASSSSDSLSTTAEPVEDSAYKSGEIYANNLVKAVKPKGYQASENNDAPAVFDTQEYHPELHDWSKLEGGGKMKWFVLGLLVVTAAALAYFVVSGQELPF